MIIKSDWHMHSKNSYDADLSIEEVLECAKKYDIKKIGITDHVNYNDKKFLEDLKNSAKYVKSYQNNHPEVFLGVELTPIAKPEFDYIEKTGTREDFTAPNDDTMLGIELALTKEELVKQGVQYAVGAAHWRVDVPEERRYEGDLDTMIREWYRQQMWLACDERVTILGHPWGNKAWSEDFSLIPHSMHMDIAAALKENKKYVECNLCFFGKQSEKFQMQYAEFIRELFEMGIPVTFGSDCHRNYEEKYLGVESALAKVGFTSEDFCELKDEDLW